VPVDKTSLKLDEIMRSRRYAMYDLKMRLLEQRGFRCEVCRRPLELLGELGHGIVTRRDVMGWKDEDQRKIDVSYNCFILCYAHNHEKAPPRAVFYTMACHRYGQDTIEGWLDSLPWKSRRRGYVLIEGNDEE
jgi:hypothetical protein